MRAILLDPSDASRKVIDLEEGLQPIYDVIGNGCTCFASPMTLENGDAVYCDDEGLFNENIGAFMDLNDWDSPIVGRVLIVGTDSEGNSVDAKSKVDDFKNWIHIFAHNPVLQNYFSQFN